MDFLKWVFTTSMAVALFFLGMSPDANNDEATVMNEKATTVHFHLK